MFKEIWSDEDLERRCLSDHYLFFLIIIMWWPFFTNAWRLTQCQILFQLVGMLFLSLFSLWWKKNNREFTWNGFSGLLMLFLWNHVRWRIKLLFYNKEWTFPEHMRRKKKKTRFIVWICIGSHTAFWHLLNSLGNMQWSRLLGQHISNLVNIFPCL